MLVTWCHSLFFANHSVYIGMTILLLAIGSGLFSFGCHIHLLIDFVLDSFFCTSFILMLLSKLLFSFKYFSFNGFSLLDDL